MSPKPIASLWMFLLTGLVSAPIYCQRNVDDDGRRGLSENVRNEILALNDKFKNYVRNHDQAGVESMYADDVIVLPDGYPPIRGLKALSLTLAWIQHVLAVEAQVMDAIPLGDSAEYVFMWEMAQTIGLDGSILFGGKSVIIWKKTESGYKIYVEIYDRSLA